MSFAPLAAGVVKPGLSEANFADPPVVALALQKALDEVSSREKQLTLVVPDAAVRVLMLEFDAMPAKAQEALPIVRFRLRKLMPFEVDDAAVSYQVMRRATGTWPDACAGDGDAGGGALRIRGRGARGRI